MRGRAFGIAPGPPASARDRQRKARPRLRFGPAAALLGIAAALWSPLAILACCPGASVVRVPVVVRPAPCLDELPPTPPTTEDDAAWSRYHAAIEAYVALVVRECGGHLLAPALDVRLDRSNPESTAGNYGEAVR